MLEVENNIWISASNGFWVVNKKTLAPRRLDFTSRRFTSMFYDRELRQIYLGDVDGIAITSPDVLNMHPTTRSIVATALYINGLLSEQTMKEAFVMHVTSASIINRITWQLSFPIFLFHSKRRISLFTS